MFIHQVSDNVVQKTDKRIVVVGRYCDSGDERHSVERYSSDKHHLGGTIVGIEGSHSLNLVTEAISVDRRKCNVNPKIFVKHSR